MDSERSGQVMDFVEIVVDGPIPVDRDDLEDALNEMFEGVGEIIGAGSGMGISDLALEVDPDRVDRTEALNRVFSVMASLEVGDSVRVRPGDGETWYRLGEWNSGGASCARWADLRCEGPRSGEREG